jgi:O-antigen/teichoic acid export membrane protein
MSVPAPASALRQVARAAASLGLLNIAALGLTFLVGVLLARFLGPAGYGVYAIAMTVTAFAGMVTEFGLPALSMREFGAAQAHGRWGEARGLMGWADRTVLTISGLLVVAVLLGGQLIPVADRSAFVVTMVWAVLLIPVVALAKLRGSALLALGCTVAGQMPVLILRPGLFVVALALAWVVLNIQPSPVGAMAMQVSAAAAALLVVALNYRRHQPAALRDAPGVNHWRRWITVSLPMGMTEGLRLLQGQMAVLILGAFSTSAAAGLYRVADSALGVCMIFSTVLNVVTGPTFARLHVRGDIDELAKVMRTTSAVMLAGTFAVGLPVVVIGPWLFGFAFGPAFAPSAHVFTILWLGALASAVTGPTNVYANMTGGERVVTTGVAAAVIVNAAVAFLLVPPLNEIGAAIATSAGLVAWNVVVYARIKRRDGIGMTALGIRPHHVRRALDLVRHRGNMTAEVRHDDR